MGREVTSLAPAPALWPPPCLGQQKGCRLNHDVLGLSFSTDGTVNLSYSTGGRQMGISREGSEPGIRSSSYRDVASFATLPSSCSETSHFWDISHWTFWQPSGGFLWELGFSLGSLQGKWGHYLSSFILPFCSVWGSVSCVFQWFRPEPTLVCDLLLTLLSASVQTQTKKHFPFHPLSPSQNILTMCSVQDNIDESLTRHVFFLDPLPKYYILC